MFGRRLNFTLIPLLSLLAFIALGASLMHGQSASTAGSCLPGDGSSASLPVLTYDVASIRPHAADDGSLSIRDPIDAARYDVTGMTMKNLIAEAYGVIFFQVSGGPSWIETQRFDIHARSDASSDEIIAKLDKCQAREVKRHMLRALLIDRVRLAAHSVVKDTSGYNLVIAKGGPKLQESSLDTTATDASSTSAPPHGGSMSIRISKPGFQLNASDFSMMSFASWLVSETHSPVVDKTGLAAKYDIQLHYSSQDALGPGSSADTPYPVIFTALQEQLGLKLEPTKTPQETIVVDHVEMPSEN